MDRRSMAIVVYGNCQARSIAEVMKCDRELNNHYEIHYLSGGIEVPADIRNIIPICTILISQLDWKFPCPLLSDVRPDCAVIRFQSSQLSFLFPFTLRVNPYNVQQPPEMPWGPFPYGDRVIIKLIEEGLSESVKMVGTGKSSEFVSVYTAAPS
jgi:hypothetical protein